MMQVMLFLFVHEITGVLFENVFELYWMFQCQLLLQNTDFTSLPAVRMNRIQITRFLGGIKPWWGLLRSSGSLELWFEQTKCCQYVNKLFEFTCLVASWFFYFVVSDQAWKEHSFSLEMIVSGVTIRFHIAMAIMLDLLNVCLKCLKISKNNL